MTRFAKAVLSTLVLALPACTGLPDIPLPFPIPTPAPAEEWDCAAPPATAGKYFDVGGAIKGRVIVTLKNRSVALNVRDVTALAAKFAGVSEVKSFARVRAFSAKVDSLETVAKILAAPEVDFVQPDAEKKLIAPRSAAGITWGLDRIDQRGLPLDGEFDPGADGAGVRVVVVDTGVRKGLAELEGRVQEESFSAIPGGSDDAHGHGTHVAGTIASLTWGVAKKVIILNARVLDANGSGSTSAVIAGIEWAVEQDADVISMSLGGSPDPALNRAACAAIEAGVTVVVAAGNESSDSRGGSPAQVKQAMTIGATDRSDRFASFSNYGPGVDLNAPGVDVESLRPDGGTATFSGTSMATPHVSGVVALYLQRHPGATPAQIDAGLVTLATPDVIQGAPAGTTRSLLYARNE